MKKQLLSIFAAVTVSTVFAQVPATAWSTNQHAIFPTSVANSGVKFMDAVDANVVWVTGIDYAAPSRNYNWYSRSINGGALFAGGNIFSDTNTYVLANMEGIDANTAWVCSYMKSSQGNGAIHRTTNGGANWVNMTAAGMFTNTAAFANWVTFFTPSVGIANGDPVNGEYEIWRTTDGGISWTQIPGSSIPNPLSGEFAIVNLYAKLGTSNLWFGTNGNRMFRSTDAGLTYSVATVGPSTNTITEIAFSSPLNGICIEVNSGGQAELYNSYDGGATWTQITPISANFGFFDIGNIPGTGNLASYGAGNTNQIISYSSDNGITWTDWGSTGIPYITGDFVDGTTAWAGSFDFVDATPTTFQNVWKFSGSISGTVAPTAAFSLPATVCLSGPTATVIPVNTSTGSPSPTFSWSVLPSGATLSSATATAPTITFASANSYTVTLVATSTSGTNTTSWVVNVAACTAPVATFSIPVSACSNFSFATGNTSTGAPAPGYFWSVSPASNVTITPSAVAANPGIQIGTAGIYSITLMVTNPTGTAASTQTLNVAPCPPTSSFALSYSCNALNTFSTTTSSSNPPGVTGSISYTWNVQPSAGVSYAPNIYSPNVKVTLGAAASGNYTITAKVKNASGTTTVTQVVTADMYLCTGINENNLEPNMSVYPNPAHEQLNIVLPATNDAYKIKLTNILGSVVFEDKTLKNSKESTTISLVGKPKGVYFLTVESNTEKVTKKIVVE